MDETLIEILDDTRGKTKSILAMAEFGYTTENGWYDITLTGKGKDRESAIKNLRTQCINALSMMESLMYTSASSW